MKIAYLDCSSGASGDMILGALIDAGVKPERLIDELSKLNLEFDLEIKTVFKKHIRATKVDVIAKEHSPHHREFKDIEEMILSSSLPESVKEKALGIFKLIASAESKVHGVPIEKVHFHEIGALDSIVDIVGSVVGFEALGIERIFASPLNLGKGRIKTAHGYLPVPAPATSLMVEGLPVYSDGTEGELLTPTGAGILKYLSNGFGKMPFMKLHKVGYGAGTMDLEIPNILRIFIGDSDKWDGDFDEVVLLETDIDDATPETIGFAVERLFEEGALDVSVSPLFMKKGRLGFRLTIITKEENLFPLVKLVFKETTTFGIRFQRVKRFKLVKSEKKVDVLSGKVRLKIGTLGDEVITVSPEYEDCKKVAKEEGISLKEVLKLALNSYRGGA